MGTYTDFTGAIRITPCLKEPLAGRDFGEDGAFFLPIHTRDLTRRICLHERYAEGLTDK